jgi:hypothetical protein
MMGLFSRLTAAAQALRPRALTRLAKSVDTLNADARELRQSLKQRAAEAANLAERTATLETTVRTLQESLSAVSLRESQLAAIYRHDREYAAALERLPALLDAVRVGDHVRCAIERAPLQLHPFPHTVIENVFPDDFFGALVTGIPPQELFGDRPVNKQRMVVPFDWAPLYSQRVWSFLIDRILDAVVAPAAVQKFRTPLAEWIHANWPQLPGDDPTRTLRFISTDGRILLRTRGYRITPHRDPKWGFITCLLYLARPGDNEAWGTQLYSVADDVEAPNINAYWIKADRCRLEKEVPFRRNSMLVFLNSGGAHGAHIPADAEPADLQRHIYQFRIGPAPDEIRALMRLLPEERRGFWEGKVAAEYS